MEGKFADNLLSDFWPFKQIHGKSTTWRSKGNRAKNILLNATHLIFAVISICIEILMYIQIFILVNAAFFLEGIERLSLIIKKQTIIARPVFWWN